MSFINKHSSILLSRFLIDLSLEQQETVAGGYASLEAYVDNYLEKRQKLREKVDSLRQELIQVQESFSRF